MLNNAFAGGCFLLDHPTYIAVLAGVAAGGPLVWIKRNKAGLKGGGSVLGLCLVFSALSTLSALLWASLEGVIGGKGFSFGAVSTYGIFLLCPLMLLALFIRNPHCRGIYDLFAVYVLPSMVLQRVHCLVNGCCYGRPFFSTGRLWPTREAEIFFYILMFFVFMRLDSKGANKTGGRFFPILMIAYGCFRFVCEFFRGDSGAGLFHITHVWSLLSVLIGVSLYTELKKRG